MAYDRNAIKVGIASFLMLAILAGLLIWKSGVFYRLDGYEIIGEFGSVNGLVNGADVRYRGSKVGKVYIIDPTPRTVRVHFRVESSIQIPKNSIVKIYFDGLIGEKFLNIIPNPNETEMLKDGGVMQGTASAGLAEFVELGAQNLETTKSLLQTYEKLLVSPKVLDSVGNTIKSVEKITQDLAILSNTLSGAGGGKGSIPQMLSNLTDTTGIVKKNAELLFGDGTVADSSKDTFRDLAAMTAQLREVVQMMSKQVVTSSNIMKINRTLDNVYDVSTGLRAIAGTEPSFGPVGLLQKWSKVKVSAVAEVVPLVQLTNSASFGGYLDSSVGGSFVRTGISGTKGSNQPVLDVQYGAHLAPETSARVGFFESHFGAGIDYHPLPKARVSLEVYNLDRPQVDLKGKYALSDHLGVVVNLKKNPVTSGYDNIGFGVSLSTGGKD